MNLVLIVLNLLAFSTYQAFCEPKYSPTVQLKDGAMRGIVNYAEDYGDTYLYQGIRYGRAERFAKPKPVDPWSGVYDATKMQFACVQSGKPISDRVDRRKLTSTNSSSEDCLFLNLWRPASEPKDTSGGRAVMVFFYGGSFSGGTIFNMVYDGRYLSGEGDVIVVTVNYRLGPFGFLYAGTEQAPGNMGLYDQIEALKWVRANIHAFGGDPHKVTIFGQSAGGMSVGALVLSPLAKGLFHRAIMQSGPVNSYFGSESSDKAIQKAKVIGEKLKCPTENMSDMLKCLKGKTAQEIDDNTKDAMANGESFVPTYGSDLLPMAPVDALKSGNFNHVDLIYGVTKDEGTGFFSKSQILPLLDPNNEHADQLHVSAVKTIIRIMFQMFGISYYQEVADFYTKNLNDSDKDQLRRTVSNAFSDYQLVCPTMFFGEEAAKHSVGHRFYSYRLNLPTSVAVMGCTKSMGVCHGEDIVYVYGIPQRLRGIVFTEDEYQLSYDMIHAWSEFAKYGHPGKVGLRSEGGKTLEWTEAVSSGGEISYTKHLALHPQQYEMVPEYYRQVCNGFWKAKLFA